MPQPFVSSSDAITPSRQRLHLSAQSAETPVAPLRPVDDAESVRPTFHVRTSPLRMYFLKLGTLAECSSIFHGLFL
nr:hypothetical protein Iba_chr06bCG17120 [Ipomoea batatas]